MIRTGRLASALHSRDARLAAVTMAVALGLSCRSAPESRWAGLEYPPLPAGVRVTGESTIGDARDARFTLTQVDESTAHFLWLSERGVGADGTTRYRVRDALPLPPLGADERLVLSVCGTAARGGRPVAARDLALDPEIIAVAVADTGALLRTVRRAWRASRGSGRIAEVPVTGWVCLNEVEEQP